MASLSNDPNGRRRIQFFDGDGNRKSIRLGKMNKKSAETFKRRVEDLVACSISGCAMDRELSLWVADLPAKMSDRFARVGLIPKSSRVGAALALKPFIFGYIDRRKDAAPNTRRIWRQTGKRLVDHFGQDAPLNSITRGDATDWRLSLIGDGLADASVRKHCGFAKHFFAQALDHELIDSNPFAKLVSSPIGNESRQFFVTAEVAANVIRAAPDAEWRLIIALSRYGGLRCPSEHLALRWTDVSWAEKRMLVTSPKTARHAGHEARSIPLFAQLMPFLQAVRKESAPTSEYVIGRYRKAGSNLRTQLVRIVKRAGYEPWPRIFHNLRSSRQTELEESFPSHVVCKWMGNSTQVARKHYLQTTEDHFARAISESCDRTKVVQNPAQHVAVGTRTDSKAIPAAQTQVYSSDGLKLVAAKYDNCVQNDKTEVHGNRTHLRNF